MQGFCLCQSHKESCCLLSQAIGLSSSVFSTHQLAAALLGLRYSQSYQAIQGIDPGTFCT